MNLMREISRAIRSTLVLWVLVAMIYPGIVLTIGQLAFPAQANGSLLKNAQGQVVGSALIGQPFIGDRYFHSRPSTINYSTANPAQDQAGILKTGVSGASNLAASNPALLERIQGQNPPGTMALLKSANITPTADLLYTSGSGLDPHITPAAAQAQIQAIAQARQLPPQKIAALIANHTEGRFLGIFGEPGVNVLKLNLALDKLS